MVVESVILDYTIGYFEVLLREQSMLPLCLKTLVTHCDVL